MICFDTFLTSLTAASFLLFLSSNMLYIICMGKYIYFIMEDECNGPNILANQVLAILLQWRIFKSV